MRKLKASATGYSEELWQEMARAGWLGLTVPEADGGLGLSWLDLTVLLEETGRGLFPSPFLSNTLATIAILELANDSQKQRLLPSLISGRQKATLALFEEASSLYSDSLQLRGEETATGIVLNGQTERCTRSRKC